MSHKMKETPEQSTWISVEDQMPKDGESVIILYEGDDCLVVDVAWYGKMQDGFFGFDTYEIWCVTHWQPLPTPPKGAGNA